MKNGKGFTIIELLIVILIFGFVMAGLYSSYVVQLRQGVQEFHTAESNMELQIARSVVERDIAMAGYGLIKTTPDPSNDMAAVNAAAGTGTTDTLTLAGIALGTGSRATQRWNYTATDDPSTLAGFGTAAANDPAHASEMLGSNDLIVYVEPNTQQLKQLAAGNVNSSTNLSWLFPYPGSGVNPYPVPMEPGNIVYGVMTAAPNTPIPITNPYYTVTYSLGGTPPGSCAPGTSNLLRSEGANPQPLLNCVRDFQVAFLLNRTADAPGPPPPDYCWDDGGTIVAGYIGNRLFDKIRTQLKQIKVYALVQEGSRDITYTYSNPDPTVASPDTIRVGDTLLTRCDGGGVGEDVVLTSDQRHYRWTVLAVGVTPRNLR